MTHTELRNARQAAGLSQKALGELAGVDQSTVSRAEAGKPMERATLRVLHLTLAALDS